MFSMTSVTALNEDRPANGVGLSPLSVDVSDANRTSDLSIFAVATPTESRTEIRTVRRTVRCWLWVCIREIVRQTQRRT
jgi:hypothetical protein